MFLKAPVPHSPGLDCPPLVSQHTAAGLPSLLLFSWLQLQGFEKQKQLEGLGGVAGHLQLETKGSDKEDRKSKETE